VIVRTIDEVIDNIRAELSRLGSSLSRFNPYSNLYIIFRAISSVITEQDSKLRNIYNEAFIKTATKEYLDRKGRDYGVYRLDGSVGYGSVLVKGTKTNIPKGLILETPNQYLQYETTESITSFEDIELPIKVMSLARASQANISPGTFLYSSLFPNHSFIVGRYRDNDGVVKGGINGADDKEDDEQYRARILSLIKGPNTGTVDAIYNSLKTLPFINRVYIEEHSPVSGYFTIVTDITDRVNLNKITDVINRVKPIGVSFRIRSLTIETVDINLRVKVISLDNISLIDNQIKVELKKLNNVLTPNQSLSKDSLSGILYQIPYIQSVDILSPLYNVSPSVSGSLLEIDNINISFYT